MNDRARWTRLLALVWATLLVASPGLGALADARLAAQTDARSHVEETTSAKCPIVHPPDCGLCRHLTNPARASASIALAPVVCGAETAARADAAPAAGIHDLTRWGRAPPSV